jgi:hypothetical protein
MSTPPWWPDLIGVSDVLVAADRAQVAHRRGSSDDESAPDDGPPDDPPLTVRLGGLGQAFADRLDDVTPEQRSRVLNVVEHVLATGSQDEGDAVATGFLEALISAWDRGFDLARIWDDMGTRSQEYCLAWNAFNGVDSPSWMRVTH